MCHCCLHCVPYPNSAQIKAVLLDQSVTAGVGNWIADEVLYQAKIHPTRPASALTTEEVKHLHATIQRVSDLRTCITA